MNTVNATEISDTKKSNQLTLILICAVAILPMLAAYTMFFTGWGVPDKTKNKGILLAKPLLLEDVLSPEVIQKLASEKKWRLLIPLTSACEQDRDCQRNFYTTRQVHIRLGEKGVRLQRWAINLDAEAGQRYLERITDEHPLLESTSVDGIVWENWVAQALTPLDHKQTHYYLLVDQQNNALMAYNVSHHGNDLLKDIKHALKFSIDYQ